MIIVGRLKGKKPSIRRLKGKLINGYLVVEDIFFVDHAAGRRHKCICKCMVCGKIRRMDALKLKSGEKPCSCDLSASYRFKFKKMRGKMLRTLTGEINRLQGEALFPGDYQRIEDLKEVKQFIKSKLLDGFFTKVEEVERARKLWMR